MQNAAILSRAYWTKCPVRAAEVEGFLQPAQVGTGVTRHLDPSSISADGNPSTVSSPKSLSLDAKHAFSRYTHLLTSLSTEMNRSLFHTDDVEDTSCLSGKALQVGYYPGSGTRYVAHRDSSPLNPYRKITVLFYVNDWKDGDGGSLRVYPDSIDPTRGSDTNALEGVDIQPRRGRMVVFRSDLLHEVLPSFAPRFAITMWLYSTADVMKRMHELRNARIFCSVPAYRDPETHPTIASLIEQAKYPDRLRIGVLYQDHPDEDAGLHEVALPGVARVVEGRGEVGGDGGTVICVMRMKSTEARGPAYARWVIQDRLYMDEEFVFLVDSHMRFARGWDTHLISASLGTQKIRAGGKPRCVSMYPPPYQPPCALGPAPWGPVKMIAQSISESDGMLRIVGRVEGGKSGGAQTQGFVAAGCLFLPREAVRSVPLDPKLEGLFFGEEMVLSARLFTHGFDAVAPGAWGGGGSAKAGEGIRSVWAGEQGALSWHLWSRKGRKTWWENNGKGREEISERARKRVWDVILAGYADRDEVFDEDVAMGGNYGLGNVRTMVEFEKLCSVDFVLRKLKREN
ncbi:GlcNAc-domain-containing protein [Cladochytrium replicatum]|nr:GlcNAc-domain-containing protein [Cladochytrium replicatum]